MAGGLDDFSNNLATDVGPLLALFGESMTKQYLSESTSFVDYFIFAMAPIGIITAIASVIRVCGHSSLRAFIGRAQEGNGTVEAELCTSTSRDVCELFNNGSITRALGRSKILEVVCVPVASDDGKNKIKIDLFQNYLQEPPPAGKKKEWEQENRHGIFTHPLQLRKGRSDEEIQTNSPEEKGTSALGIKQPGTFINPNLSINIGIVKPPKKYFYFLATLGFVLQTGVMAMACVLSLREQWTKDGKPETLADIKEVISKNPATIFFVVGTSCLCTGIFCCAALIGQITDERSYRRKEGWGQPSRLFWLQPGNLRVGDQTFDPFAYTENSKSRFSKYTTSIKKEGSFELYTWGAIGLTLGGYIMQFIGLRGMTAYVSIAQLGITALMSFFRGCLRMRRLQKQDNDLNSLHDMVVGYELDWLAFKIESTCASQPNTPSPNPQQYTSGDRLQNTPHFEKVVKYRAQLARLTGHDSLSLKCQKWDDDQIKVRVHSRRLADAICQAAEILLPRGNIPELKVKLSSSYTFLTTLEPSDDLSKSRFGLDSAELEGVLGAWLWSLLTYRTWDDVKLQVDTPEKPGALGAEEIPTAQIISDSGEMSLWLGKDIPSSEAILCSSQECHYNSWTLWEKGESNTWRPHAKRATGGSQHYQRFFGWNAAQRPLSLSTSPSDPDTMAPNATRSMDTPDQEMRVQFFRTQSSLLSECSKELFTTILASIANHENVQTIQPTPEESSDQLRWASGQIKDIAAAFVECSLGSMSDALLCIIPALRVKLRYPGGEDIADAARHYRKQDEWDRAESLLKWACDYYRHGSDEGNFSRVLVELGELYRWSLVHSTVDRYVFGYSGIKRMLKTYGPDKSKPKNAKVAQIIPEILDRYYEVTLRVAKKHHQEGEFDVEWQTEDGHTYRNGCKAS